MHRLIISIAAITCLILPGGAATPKELPLPEVPATLRQPSERAAYILGHFWDSMEWTDTIRSLDTDFMEQNMVNFINLFQYTDSASVSSAVSVLMTAAAIEPKAYAKIMDIADTYLYDHESPMPDEEYYRLFLMEALSSPAISAADKMRLDYQKAELDKNRRGTKGADFDYIDTDGHHGTLYGFGADDAMKLVIFYDPDCDDCTRLISWLRSDSRVQRMVNDGSLSIIAIYPDGDPEAWATAADKMPSGWTNAYSPDGAVSAQDIYTISSTPAIYLLTADNIVAGKNLTLAQLDEWIAASCR